MTTDAFSAPTAPAHAPAAERLGDIAADALAAEARLTPKPGLVDARGPGAHDDLSLELLLRSCEVLRPWFRRFAETAWLQTGSQELRERLGRQGREAEALMLLATDRVNTHRGAVWAVGLLVAATAQAAKDFSFEAVAWNAARLAALRDSNAVKGSSHGEVAMKRFQVRGALGEARDGFPHVFHAGLPELARSRRAGASENEARLNALLAIMATLDDTCLLHRGGWNALLAGQRGAAFALEAGGVQTARGRERLLALDRDLKAQHASPGGAADLLAATMFMDAVAADYATRGNTWSD